jgi:phosphoribosylamine--glycine ligase
MRGLIIMKVLVIGGGGREHAIVWKLSQNPKIDKLYCAPGNGGISKIAECVPIKVIDIEGIINFSKNEKIDFVFVAPDDPLALGLVDALENAGIRAFGPSKKAAVIESSKVFSKALMKKYGIPTADYETFNDMNTALVYLKHINFPVAVKADGLALGKGVILCDDYDEAVKAVEEMMIDKAFGDAGNSILIEEYLYGPEVTVLAFMDGKTVVPMVSSQDHKRALDNDMGLNTGGMGAFSPSRIYTYELAAYCMEKIFIPSMEAMNSENMKFKGVIYFGLMITKDGPKVIEYNARFGDPEAQVTLFKLKTDLLEIADAIIDEKLDTVNIEWSEEVAACVVIASGGYPEKYDKGFEITGIDNAEKDSDIVVFHAGTTLSDGKYITNGGRVLGVTAKGATHDEAIKKAYEGVKQISFKNMHFRNDIGIK